MKLRHQLISWCLALCFAFAGAVGTSPILHHLIEHGGQGPVHAHGSVMPQVSAQAPAHEHGDTQWHSHTLARPRPTGLFVHSHKPFELPTISLGRLCHLLSHLRAMRTSSDESPSNDSRGHEHRSLFQLMASGLVEQPLEVPLLSFVPATFVAYELPANSLLLVREWDAQTASRGPPPFRS